MSEQRLIAAMEAKVADRIAEIDHETKQKVQDIEGEANNVIADNKTQEQANAETHYLQYKQEQEALFENKLRVRIRSLHFQVSEEVFGKLEDTLSEINKRSDYHTIWGYLFKEALSAYRIERTDQPILHVNPEDSTLAKSIASGSDIASIEPHSRIAAGVELLSSDGRVRVVNTPMSRFRKGREEYVKIISDMFKKRLSL